MKFIVWLQPVWLLVWVKTKETAFASGTAGVNAANREGCAEMRKNMPSFLSDITPFLGTGEVNAEGLGLREYLEGYDPGAYENPGVTADILVLRYHGNLEQVEEGCKVLLIRRGNHPCIGQWALPGGFVNIREDLETAARRELQEETGLKGLPMEQLHTWGEAERDPRSRVITTAYLALVGDEAEEIQAGDDAADAIWADLSFRQISKSRVWTKRGERLERRYEIVLKEMDQGLYICSEVSMLQKEGCILKEPMYTVLQAGGLAFDHPRFLLQGLLYLKEKLDACKQEAGVKDL